MLPVHRAILSTLSYFDVFSYPLTIEQVWRWLYAREQSHPGDDIRSATPYDVELAIRDLERQQAVERIGPYVTLHGQSWNVAIRMERAAISRRLWRRARWAC